MARSGNKVCLHGAFKTAKAAERRAEKIGSRVAKRIVAGVRRFVVIGKKK